MSQTTRHDPRWNVGVSIIDKVLKIIEKQNYKKYRINNNLAKAIP